MGIFRKNKEIIEQTIELKPTNEDDLRKRIDKNREEINKWLNGDYPLDIVYMRIRMLSAQNESLISRLK